MVLDCDPKLFPKKSKMDADSLKPRCDVWLSNNMSPNMEKVSIFATPMPKFKYTREMYSCVYWAKIKTSQKTTKQFHYPLLV